MKRSRRFTYGLGVLMGALLVAGPVAANPATLSVVESSQKDGVIEVAVLLEQPDATRRPVLAEVFVEYDPKRLSFLDGEAGVRSRAAQKAIFAHEVSNGVVRFTLMGVSLQPIANGKLALLRFAAVAPGPARVAIENKRTRFAPKRAREALTFGNPITVQVSK
jgi:hypothetical protein